VSYDVLNPPVPAGLNLAVAGDMLVEQGATINVDAIGYGAGAGPGAGVAAGNPASGSGGGHGGCGGQSAALDGYGTVYDLITQPASLGSGGGLGNGGPGGAGGGSIKLVVGGTLRIDGAVSANGAGGMNERSGGGSGGSIWLVAANLTGAGTLSANGGTGEPSLGGGGGGGRIALQYDANAFSGSIVARGGAGYTRGGAGTIYSRANGQSTAQVLVDNGGKPGMKTLLTATEPFDLTVQGGAIVSPSGSTVIGNLAVSSNAWVSLVTQLLTVTGDAKIQAGGGIIADGSGSPGGQGPGAGRFSASSYVYTGGGGGYGGYGAAGGGALAYGGMTYGTVTSPVIPGSGGGSYIPSGGGAGGGVIHLNVTGMLLLDGRISADGALGFNEGSGGGSGGSVSLNVGTITGAGAISANGGNGNGIGLTGGGGGGGGRIAIQYALNLFFGTTAARGGSGSAWGGAGTIYTKANSQSFGLVLADNGGQSGTNTSWVGSGTVDLTVKGGAVVSTPSQQTIGTLLVASNGWLNTANQLLTVTGNATVQAGGGIIADGMGNAANLGLGAGRYVSSSSGYVGGGAGYGGYGAAGIAAPQPYVAYGGSIYGSLTSPTDLGSGGGSYYPVAGPSSTTGGAGGGALRLNVTGILQVDGRISANGLPATGPSAGGGSGGSVWLTVGTLSGSGVISANGGAGILLGGGGGGGRIALQYGSSGFSGLVSAYGGSGYATGGAGTIYNKANSQPVGQVVVDNAGQAGTNTAWTSFGTIDLTVKAGSVVSLPQSQTIGTLLVASNGWLKVSYPNQNITVTGNAAIQAGGGIIADGNGNPAQAGQGGGRYISTSSGTFCSGGGYGGAGAVSGGPSPVSGGRSYGSVTSPSDLGSGGGSPSGSAISGAGGGAILLTVTGTLQVDGRISAAGQDGAIPNGGGGSGGSIFLTVGTLAGSGTISVNGGAGNDLGGGGGGGGRIAIQHNSYAFDGLLTAFGGAGFAAGGAGTIYTKANSQSYGLVFLDNGGQAGTNTSWSSGPTVDLTIRGGAVFSPPLSPQNIGTLLVASNGWVSFTNQSQVLNISGNATIQAGGGIIADGNGNPPGVGTGSGRTYSIGNNAYIGGGGGYGGFGGSGSNSLAYGGVTYGSVTAPTDLGSGGGTYSTYAVGGAGGGPIRLSVNGTLEVDGEISAAGSPAVGASAGGGSGGSIYLTVGTLSGSGLISANGGPGKGFGGGGAGGRIAVLHSGNTFSGAISAYGGGGYGWGSAGTIYTKANTQTYGLILLDNGGNLGTNTTWTSLGTADLTVKGGAIFSPSTSQTLANLLVASNGWVMLFANQGLGPTLTVTGNATVQPGGGIIADGTGYSGQYGSGPGAGSYYSIAGGYVGGGGGYGGFGAAAGATDPKAPGGNVYGIVSQPTAGSAGGTYSTYFISGAGGGAITLNVTGVLAVNGRISAAGGSSTVANGGGGSGGGILLTVGTLSGSGLISANGGSGNGLGGGRIALLYSQNTFSGLVSSYGGGGFGRGGAGTIYTKANNQQWGQVLVDNNGQSSTNSTSIAANGTSDLTVRGGATVTPSSPQTLGNLTVASNGWLSVSGQTLTVTGNAIVQSGGAIVADGTGYPSGQGPGAGRYAYLSPNYVGGGGGYGGYGAVSGAIPAALGGGSYGSVTAPVDRGSGGGSGSSSSPGGAGGGAIRLTAGGLVVNGRISAAGSPGVGQGSGGGSGGSVWLMVGTLSGVGTISANGGMGNELGGGGAGGRIAVQYAVNAFGGSMTAYGGGGFAAGGAGTIYTKANNQAMGQMFIDNGGQSGTNTPVPFLSPFDLTVRNGAIANPSSSYLVLSNLFVGAGGSFTCLRNQTNLDLTILRNATTETGAMITVDGLGYAIAAGPGAGLSSNSIGSGAGYGGQGGATALSSGGVTYGSALQPVDRGSGGGRGWAGAPVGSDGGGALHLSVGGTLLVNGRLSAGGNAGSQDDSGGGSGGSVWVAAGNIAGTGAIAAVGGAGELYQGGGGGGGRIALYSRLNSFGGLVSASGGAGGSPGTDGTIYYSTNFTVPEVVSVTPTGSLNHAVTSVDVLFNTPINPYSVLASTVSLTDPNNSAVSGLFATAPSPYLIHISFPQQTAQGVYTLSLGPQIQDLFGQPMSQVYTSTFSIRWSIVVGTVTDTNGLPVPGVVLQPDSGTPSATTDTNGFYALPLPPGLTVNVTPSMTNLMFVPASRSYYDLTASIVDENYLAVSTTVPNFITGVQTNGLVLSWYGIPGVTYQPLYSTNLVDWLPYDGPLQGSNAMMQIVFPVDGDPVKFFNLRATY
jgi:hypothetical protein